MGIEATQFVTSSGRQVLTNDGQQGMGKSVGSTTEKMQGRVAEAILLIVLTSMTTNWMKLLTGFVCTKHSLNRVG